MKKDKKYFLKNFLCKISKLKRDNNIELIRGPLATVSIEAPLIKSPNTNGQVSYDEMIPGDSRDLLNQSPKTLQMAKNSITALNQEQQNTMITMEDEFSPYPVTYVEEAGNTEGTLDAICPDNQQQKLLKSNICSVCGISSPRIGWHRDFKYAELYEATKGFSDENFLGEGGFGSVYKGELKNGLQIAVKQHKDASLQGEKEFKSEVEVLSKVRHENLVMLLGSCSEGCQRLLVYEYVCNGSLDLHLSKHAKRVLTWEHRVKIALGTAQGLQYLHSRKVIHRDMRPNNILITHDYRSLLGDFGLAKTQQDSNSGNSVVGTLGYMAPEYAQTGKFSTKTDVYSFGVVLLQLITGRRTMDMIPEGKSLISWAKPLLKDKNYPDLIDKRIIDSHDLLQLFWVVRLTEKCISNDPSERFAMEKVVKILNSIRDATTICIGDNSQTSDSAIRILDSFDAEEYGTARQ